MGTASSKVTKGDVFGSSSMDESGFRAFLLKYTVQGCSVQVNLPLAQNIDKQTVRDHLNGLKMGNTYHLSDDTLYESNTYTIRLLDGHLRVKLNSGIYELKLSTKRDIVINYLEFLLN